VSTPREQMAARDKLSTVQFLLNRVIAAGAATGRVLDTVEKLRDQALDGDEAASAKALAILGEIVTAYENVDHGNQRASRGPVQVEEWNHKDSRGRRKVVRRWDDGTEETEFFDEMEWAQHLEDRTKEEEEYEAQVRGVKIQYVPEEYRDLVGDVDAILARIKDHDLPVEDRQQLLRVLRPAMMNRDYQRLGELAWSPEEVTA
jgi:ribosomal 50S subunit-associated protein YjgA (DUF615 family)